MTFDFASDPFATDAHGFAKDNYSVAGTVSTKSTTASNGFDADFAANGFEADFGGMGTFGNFDEPAFPEAAFPEPSFDDESFPQPSFDEPSGQRSGDRRQRRSSNGGGERLPSSSHGTLERRLSAGPTQRRMSNGTSSDDISRASRSSRGKELPRSASSVGGGESRNGRAGRRSSNNGSNNGRRYSNGGGPPETSGSDPQTGASGDVDYGYGEEATVSSAPSAPRARRAGRRTSVGGVSTEGRRSSGTGGDTDFRRPSASGGTSGLDVEESGPRPAPPHRSRSFEADFDTLRQKVTAPPTAPPQGRTRVQRRSSISTTDLNDLKSGDYGGNSGGGGVRAASTLSQNIMLAAQQAEPEKDKGGRRSRRASLVGAVGGVVGGAVGGTIGAIGSVGGVVTGGLVGAVHGGGGSQAHSSLSDDFGSSHDDGKSKGQTFGNNRKISQRRASMTGAPSGSTMSMRDTRRQGSLMDRIDAKSGSRN